MEAEELNEGDGGGVNDDDDDDDEDIIRPFRNAVRRRRR